MPGAVEGAHEPDLRAAGREGRHKVQDVDVSNLERAERPRNQIASHSVVESLSLLHHKDLCASGGACFPQGFEPGTLRY